MVPYSSLIFQFGDQVVTRLADQVTTTSQDPNFVNCAWLGRSLLADKDIVGNSTRAFVSKLVEKASAA